MAILCIAQDGHFVVIQVNLVDEHTDQALPVFGVIDVTLAELTQEKADVPHTGNGVLCGFYQQLIGQFIVFLLLLGDAFSDSPFRGVGRAPTFPTKLFSIFLHTLVSIHSTF
ncbi:MAG: hypothetical protein K2O11_00670 [Oscillospiraceae bacterium]|nr:hypothetical protein [Oscillospiraceae bacterium]